MGCSVGDSHQWVSADSRGAPSCCIYLDSTVSGVSGRDLGEGDKIVGKKEKKSI